MQWSRTEKNDLYDVNVVVINKWAVVKCGMYSYRQPYSSKQWSIFFADSLDCTSWVIFFSI